MKKVAFISFSDIHFHDWPSFGQKESRLKLYSTLFSRLHQLGYKYDCRSFLFSGDLVHSNQAIDNIVLDALIDELKWFTKDNKVWAISGNHDQVELSTSKHYSKNYVNTLSKVLPNFICVDNKISDTFGLRVYGIPYLNDPDSFMKSLPKVKDLKKTILLMHQTLPGSVEGNGYKIESSFTDKIFKALEPFGLVLNGHIHKHKIHKPNVLTVGATHQQRVSDMGVMMGCWLIYEDLTYKFESLEMPEFVYGESNGWSLGVDKPEIKEELEDPEKMEFHTGNKIDVIVENYLKKRKIKSPSKKKALLKYLS